MRRCVNYTANCKPTALLRNIRCDQSFHGCQLSTFPSNIIQQAAGRWLVVWRNCILSSSLQCGWMHALKELRGGVHNATSSLAHPFSLTYNSFLIPDPILVTTFKISILTCPLTPPPPPASRPPHLKTASLCSSSSSTAM